jgi:hypothetical protein
VRKHVAIPLGILALTAGIAASGCSGGPDAEAESRPLTTTEHVETQPRTHPVVDISRFRAAFRKAYGTPPNRTQWYGLITGMKMTGMLLDITTKLPPGSTFEVDPVDDNGAICGAAVKLAMDLGVMNNGIRGVRLMGSDGVELGGCA